MIRQRDEPDETARLLLQRPQLTEMIHAVGERFDMAVKHRAGAAPAHPVPGAVNVEIFLGRFLPSGDGRTHLPAKNLRPAAGKRVEAGLFQFNQCLLDGFLCDPGEVQHFNGRKTFELQSRGRDGALR